MRTNVKISRQGERHTGKVYQHMFVTPKKLVAVVAFIVIVD